MKGIAAMKRRIALSEWEGHWPSQNAVSAADGAIASIALDGQLIGMAFIKPYRPPYSFELGVYPNERYHGAYRTENAMLNGLARLLLDREEDRA